MKVVIDHLPEYTKPRFFRFGWHTLSVRTCKRQRCAVGTQHFVIGFHYFSIVIAERFNTNAR